MSRFLRRVFAIFSLVITIVIVLGFIISERVRLRTEKRSPPCVCCEGRVTRDTITPLEDNRTFIIAPYYDDRQSNRRLVRTLSITHHQEVKELYCWFCCGDNMTVKISKAEMDRHSDRFDFPYVTTDLLCAEPPDCDAKYLSIHPSGSGNMSQLPLFRIMNQDRGRLTVNFTVCISTMFGNFSNVLQLIQSVEMYRILGAQRVIIYLSSCSPLMDKVMQYYIQRGILEVIPWPIERYLQTGNAWHHSMDPKDIGYYGQLATLNDCIYRNMYRSRYVLLNDIDEIILPFSHQTWDSMMEDLEHQNMGAGIFLFENHIFSQTASTDGKFEGTSSWNAVPGHNILQHVHRILDTESSFEECKMILDPRKVAQTSVHSVLKSYGREIRVPMKTALVYHCRRPKNSKKTLMIEDKTIWRHNRSLITNVNKVLRGVSLPSPNMRGNNHH